MERFPHDLSAIHLALLTHPSHAVIRIDPVMKHRPVPISQLLTHYSNCYQTVPTMCQHIPHTGRNMLMHLLLDARIGVVAEDAKVHSAPQYER